MQLAAFTVLYLSLCVFAAAAVPTYFVKEDNGGWNIVTSKSLAQRILNEAEWMTFWENDVMSDDEDEAEAARQWSKDHDNDDTKDGSGDDDDDDDKRERLSVCIHRATQHNIERGSIEINHSLCLLCACHISGILHCQKTC